MIVIYDENTVAVINYLKYFLVNKLEYKSIAKKTSAENERSQEVLENGYNEFI